MLGSQQLITGSNKGGSPKEAVDIVAFADGKQRDNSISWLQRNSSWIYWDRVWFISGRGNYRILHHRLLFSIFSYWYYQLNGLAKWALMAGPN